VLTYDEFLSLAAGFASALRELGVEKGMRVALMSENRYEWCAAYLGIQLTGAVAVPMDARLTPPEVRNILADSEAVVSIHSGETRPAVTQATEGLSVKLVDMEQIEPVDSPNMTAHESEGSELASLLYTSGTTGSPKGVMLTHDNLLLDGEAVREAGIITPTENVLSILPLHHTYAFMCTFLVPLLLGASVTYPTGLKGPEIKAAVTETGVTVLVGVPQLMELTRNRIFERLSGLPGPLGRVAKWWFRFTGFLRRRWDINVMGLFFHPMGKQFRFLTSGGARLDPKVMGDLESLGFTVIEGYGLTETSPIITFSPLERRKPGSVGCAVKGAEFRIIEPDAQGVGEISVRGPMVMQGYYHRPEETAKVLDDEGWFRTGDLGYFDRDGYLFITGRAKEVIVLASGKNIYPEEVEKHYQQEPLIKELAVFEEGGKLRAVVVPDFVEAKARKIANLNEKLRWQVNTLSGHLPPHMRIMGYTLRSEPRPRTPLGKLRRFMIQKEALPAGAPSPAAEDTALMQDAVGRVVAGRIRALVGDDIPVRYSDNMELDLGLDSLTRVELLVALEREFGMQLPEEEMAEVQKVEELVEAVKRRRGEGGAGAVTGEHADPMDAVLSGEPLDEDKRSVGFNPSGLAWATTVFAVSIVKLIARLMFRLSSKGVENIPEPPYIIAPNHESFLDAFMVGAAMPMADLKQFHALGVRKFFRGPVGEYLARIGHVILIDPEAHINRAMGLSAYVLRNGEALMVFPEGGRSFDGGLMEFKKGVGILAVKLGVPVVPVHIEGAFEAWPRQKMLPRPGRVSVSFGAPLRPGDVSVAEGVDPAQAFVDELKKRVEALKG
jgi:long-chain acyl-CoA synthetase